MADRPPGSPFPGMDPFLEAFWPEVHHRLCTYTTDFLNEALGGSLRASIDERVRLVEYDEDGDSVTRVVRPDVAVSEPWSGSPAVAGAAVLEATEVADLTVEPVELRLEEIREPFIEIHDVAGRRLLTTIEFVSPANKKPGEGRRQYLQKQGELHTARVSLVEIDLTRSGEPYLLAHEAGLSRDRDGIFSVSVFRGFEPERLVAYPIPMLAALPDIPVPTRPSDPEVALPLQACLDRAYANGRYAGLIDYAAEPDPPLDERHRRWLNERLPEGNRSAKT